MNCKESLADLLEKNNLADNEMREVSLSILVFMESGYDGRSLPSLINSKVLAKDFTSKIDLLETGL